MVVHWALELLQKSEEAQRAMFNLVVQLRQAGVHGLTRLASRCTYPRLRGSWTGWSARQLAVPARTALLLRFSATRAAAAPPPPPPAGVHVLVLILTSSWPWIDPLVPTTSQRFGSRRPARGAGEW